MHGRLALLNTPLIPSEQRKKQLENTFGTSWIGDNEGFINVQTALIWRCETSGFGNDGFTECGDVADRHSFASLIVIKSEEK